MSPKKAVLILLLFISNRAIYAQSVGINDNGSSPNNQASLDLQSSDKGLLIPRIALQSLSSPSPLGNHVLSMCVYNTTTNLELQPGFYVNNGSKWISLGQSVVSQSTGIDVGYIVSWPSSGALPNFLLPLNGGTYYWSDYPDLQSVNQNFPLSTIANSNNSTFTLIDINDNRILRGNSTTGNIGGSNEKVITQATLPNINLSSSNSGDHSHSVQNSGQHAHNTNAAGSHSHEHNSTSQVGLVQSSNGGNNTSNGQNLDQTLGEPNLTSPVTTLIINPSGSHTHNLSSDGQHSHTLDNSGIHEHLVSLGGQGLPISVEQSYGNILWCVKAKSTGKATSVDIQNNTINNLESYQPTNGLQAVGNGIGLGGSLAQTTTITLNNNYLGLTNGKLAIGAGLNESSAVLQVNSTNKGMLIPRLSANERNSITNAEIGMLIYNTTTECLNLSLAGNAWYELCGTSVFGTVSSLNCAGTVHNGNLLVNTNASGVNSVIPYTGGNGNAYAAVSVTSTGVSGLTASIPAGNFELGSGNLTIQITGTPNSVGTATFIINIGGHTCTINRSVGSVTIYPAGYVHCNSSFQTPAVDVINSYTGKIWMDRNLGATNVASSPTDAMAMGSLFQYGRRADGHQCINRFAGDGVTTSNTSAANLVYNTDIVPHGDFIIHNFTVGPGGTSDWRSPANPSLWQGVNGINNPCPQGYRLPTDAEVTAERNSWVAAPINSTNNTNGAFASPLKLTAAGIRDRATGTINGIGTAGRYWTGSLDASSRAITLNFQATSASNATSHRTFGLSVRCIKN